MLNGRRQVALCIQLQRAGLKITIQRFGLIMVLAEKRLRIRGAAHMQVHRSQGEHKLHMLVPSGAHRPHLGHGSVIGIYGHQTGDAALGHHFIYKIRTLQATLGQRRLNVVEHHGQRPHTLRPIIRFSKPCEGVRRRVCHDSGRFRLGLRLRLLRRLGHRGRRRRAGTPGRRRA